MFEQIKQIGEGLGDLLFPAYALYVEGFYPKMHTIFAMIVSLLNLKKPNPDFKQSSSDTLLPEGISLQHALWKFDKGGYLQELLHAFKYHSLVGIGHDLGIALAHNVIENPHFKLTENSVIVPVPLHPKKMRKRGYNQARFIAEGVHQIMLTDICDPMSVVRVKNTRTQTGFTLKKRRENIERAFRVEISNSIQGKDCIIVDDVFTTGATAFELSDTLLKAGANETMIITIAQA